MASISRDLTQADQRTADHTITQEEVEELYDFLQGELPEGVYLNGRSMPKLSPRVAFNIIWFLQERMRVLPDRYERCITCNQLYDSWNEGHYSPGRGNHCDSCDTTNRF